MHYNKQNNATATDYVTFNSNQFKVVDNTNPKSNSDIKNSISPKSEMVDNNGKEMILEASNLENNKSLMAIHNLNDVLF